MAAATRRKMPLFYVASTALAIVAAFALMALGPTGWTAIIAYGAVMVALMGAMVWAYLRIDETAREAQKSAWLWGGIAGFLVASVLALAMMVPESPAPALLPAWPPALIFHLGIASALVLQSVGYLIVWTIWWLAKR